MSISNELYLSLMDAGSYDVLLDYCLENDLCMPCDYPFTSFVTRGRDIRSRSWYSSWSYSDTYVSCSGMINTWRARPTSQ